MSLLDTASLIVTPNAYKEGKLYSVIPSDGSGDLSVTRATTATRVNSAGLVELVPYNIYEYSEQFDNGYWNKLGSTIGANSVVAPNGTTTADKVIETSTTADHYVTRASNFTQGLTYTISVYAKAGERNWLAVGFNNEAQRLAWFNLSTGVVGTVLSSVTATSIESVGNGWYRCSATMTAATNLPYPSIMIAPSNGVKNYLGNGTNGLYIWGAQFVEGASALSYQRTETRLNIPRLDYSNGSCPSLLVEPQRTNTVTYSEQLDNSNWVKGDATISANSAIAPNGTNTADKFIANSNNAAHLFYQSVPTGSCSFSIYAKAAEETVFSMWLNDFSKNARFDLSTGTVVFSNVTSANITNVGNGWYRCEVYDTTSTSFVAIFGRNAAAYIGNGVNGMFFWGAQAEVGSYATSYIPTTSASVTRNDDFISKTSATSLIGQTEGTIFVDFYNDGNAIYNPFSISDGYYGDAIYFEQFLGQMYGVIWDGGSQQFSFNAGALSIGNHKMAIAYKTNDIAFYIDGVLKATDSSATIPTCSRIDVGYLASATVYKTFINAAALWKTRLTNAQLAQLTTI